MFLHLDLGTRHCQMQMSGSVRRTPRKEGSHVEGIQIQQIREPGEGLEHEIDTPSVTRKVT